ncbi:hypothetical protein [Corallincola spongiicola]|uniref:Uncharacterized protein n=1 Tax=Corallincola spongiicola TaxID=2520508 RepID=A0ABY1WLC9_9GAMM|nr:hypothetical protein [Corallincola spongiicola]TAA41725.1 hypothetical protein EXY25_15905 [Corallincola spongiicola]
MDFDSLDKSIKTELWTSLPLYLLAITIPVLAWLGFLQIDADLGVWFQRSGSLMVLFAVWVEFKLFKITNFSNPLSPGGQTWDDLETGDRLKDKYSSLIQILKYFAALLAILGTLIWGYGDLFRNVVA